MAEATIKLQAVKETDDLSKFVTTVLPADLRDTLRQVSAFEIEQQRAFGNYPSAIIVDGRQQSIESANRRVQALFADSRMLQQALTEAFAMLRQLTRIQTGRARREFFLYVNDSPVGNEGAIAAVASRMTNRDNAVVYGPVVPYGRKLYWNPAGGQEGALRSRTVKKTRGEYRTFGGEKIKVKVAYREPMHRIVERALKRKYGRVLTIKEAWLSTQAFRAFGGDASGPGLMIRYKSGRRARGSL